MKKIGKMAKGVPKGSVADDDGGGGNWPRLPGSLVPGQTRSLVKWPRGHRKMADETHSKARHVGEYKSLRPTLIDSHAPCLFVANLLILKECHCRHIEVGWSGKAHICTR